MGGGWQREVAKRIEDHGVASTVGALGALGTLGTLAHAAARRRFSSAHGGAIALGLAVVAYAGVVVFDGHMQIRVTMVSMLLITAVGTVVRFATDRNDILQASPDVVPMLLGCVALGTLNWQLIYLTALLNVATASNGLFKAAFARLRSGDSRIQRGNPFNVTRPNPLGTGRREHTFGTFIPPEAHEGARVPGCSAFYKGKVATSSGMPSGHSQFAATLAVFVGIMLLNGGWVQRRDADATAKMLGRSELPEAALTAGRVAGVASLAAFVGAVMWHRWHTTHCHSAAQVLAGASLGAGIGALGYAFQTRELTSSGRLMFRGAPRCKQR